MNRESNVEGSLSCLGEAIDLANDPRVLNRHDLPLAETHLNLSNALTFLQRNAEALMQAEKANILSSQTCERHEQAMADPSIQGTE